MADKKSEKGYLFCTSNDMFATIGDNVYKLDVTKNTQDPTAIYKLMSLVGSVVEHKTELLDNVELAKKKLFEKLKSYATNHNNRGFFRCDLQTIIAAMNEIDDSTKKQ